MMGLKHLLIGALIGVQLPCISFAHEAFAKPLCSADSCLAAAQKGAKRGGTGDCKGFFRVTVIPSTVKKTITHTEHAVDTMTSTHTIHDIVATITTTSTTTSTVTQAPAGKRSVKVDAVTKSQTTLPKYASKACENAARYSSACSCIGARHSTVTRIQTITAIATATHTRTSSATTSTTETDTSISVAATSTTYSCPQPQPTFNLQIDGGTYSGYLAYTNPSDEGIFYFGAPGDNGSSYVAQVLTRDAQCFLIDTASGYFVTVSQGEGVFNSGVFLSQSSSYDPDLSVDVTPLICIPSAGLYESCFPPEGESDLDTSFNASNNQWLQGLSSSGDPGINLIEVPSTG